MIKTFYALDNEFAAATGGNVNNGPGTSTFDYPPNSTMDLIITSKEGDSDPNLFEVGESYEVTFAGNGGSTISDAVVIRSDPAGTGGAVVFEGLNEFGDLVQVVWTPGFDLEQWYWDNFNPGAPPGFYTSDQDPTYTHAYVCFAAETWITTPSGPVAAGRLRLGDRVLTRDHGAETVTHVARRRVVGQGANTPVRFARGAIGNTRPLRISPQHRVMVTSSRAELWFGSPEVLVPAKALINGGTIRPAPCARITYVHLAFDRHEVISAENTPCESLFAGDHALGLVPAHSLPRGLHHGRAARPILTYAEARALIGLPRPVLM